MLELTRREIGLFGGSGLLAVSMSLRGGEATALPAVAPFDPTPFVHPDLRFLVPQFLQYKTALTFSSASLGQLRTWLNGAKPDPEARSIEVPGPRNGPPVRLYVMNEAKGGEAKPAILYVHGGGYVAGSAAGETSRLLQLARACDCTIVAVEYRLAPETPFPGPLEDCYAALLWLHGNAPKLGVDPQRIALMGESAGGGLAAMLAIAARDRGDVAIMFQVLVYPMLDDRTGSTRPVSPPIGYLTWDSAANRFGWSAFLGKPAGSTTVHAGSVPARVERLAGLPRTFIGVGSIDLFVSEDVDYARRLIEQGVPTELLVIPGAFHGFQTAAPNAAVSVQFNAAIRNALTNAFSAKW